MHIICPFHRPARNALERNLSLGWRAVLEAHETAWEARWAVGDVIIEGDDELQRAVRFAVERAQRQAAEQRQAVLGDRLQLLLDASAEGICWLDPAGDCTFVNPAAAALVGRRPDELVGHNLHDAVHVCDDGVDPARCRLRAALGGAEPLDASTPAGVVQRYTEDVIDGDEAAAREHLVAEARDGCERLEPGLVDDVRVTLVATTERGDSADVEVSIVTSSGGGLLGPSEYREDATFGLVREASGWAIEAVPWQFAICVESTP